MNYLNCRDNWWKNSHRDDWRKFSGNESHYSTSKFWESKNGWKRNGIKKDEERLKNRTLPRTEKKYIKT